MRSITPATLKGLFMKHLNEWDQHFIQSKSEFELAELELGLAHTNEHSGQVIRTPSWLEKFFGGKTDGIAASKAVSPEQNPDLH